MNTYSHSELVESKAQLLHLTKEIKALRKNIAEDKELVSSLSGKARELKKFIKDYGITHPVRSKRDMEIDNILSNEKLVDSVVEYIIKRTLNAIEISKTIHRNGYQYESHVDNVREVIVKLMDTDFREFPLSVWRKISLYDGTNRKVLDGLMYKIYHHYYLRKILVTKIHTLKKDNK